MKFRTFLTTALMVVLFAATALAAPASQDKGEKKLGAFEITALRRQKINELCSGHALVPHFD